MLNLFKVLLRDERGAELVEYGLLVSLIAIVALVAVHTFGKSVSGLYRSEAGGFRAARPLDL